MTSITSAAGAPASTSTGSSAVENVGRFLTDSLLHPAALEDFFKGDLAPRREVTVAFDEAQRLWRRNVYRTVGEDSLAGPTRQAWLLPLLRLLRHEPRPGVALETERGAIPVSHVEPDPVSERPLILYDLGGFSEPFDRAVRGGNLRGTRHTQMEYLLAEADVPWGILASGTHFRLLRKDTSGEPRYLQFALEPMLQQDDTDSFWLFYQLLRKDAFEEREAHGALLRQAIEESEKIGTGVSKALGESGRVALETFLRELVRDEANRSFLEAEIAKPGGLEKLHLESLLFLYRLLFVFFAESRRLLPVDNPTYFGSYSLEAWRDKLYHPELFHAGDYYLWGSLDAVFRLIERGFDSNVIRIPAYNGGLFARRRTPILSRCKLNDLALREVLFELSTTEIGKTKKQKTRDRVSYRELGVEQLGAVYEGLLEFNPRLATQEMVVVRSGSGKNASAQILHRQEAERIGEKTLGAASGWESIPAGTVYLAASGGQRKGSGSYYTPSVITRFLVEQALKPQIEPILEKCAHRNEHGEPLGHPDEILKLKVIDPAMGSGAFLVAATHYLAEQYGKAKVAAGLDEDGRISEEERSWYRRRVAEHCIYGVDLNPLAVELAKVSLWLSTLAGDRPLTFLDHHLRCGNSLIGAPIRQQKIRRTRGKKEVTEVLWIDRVPDAALQPVGKKPSKEEKEAAKKRIAANAKALERLESGQGTVWELDQKKLEKTLDGYLKTREILEEDDEVLSIADALELHHRKERVLQESYQDPASPVARVKALADLWCSVWFWPQDERVPPPTTDELRQAARLLVTGQLATDVHRANAIIETARNVAREQRFFHWELEFPEVYRDTEGAWKKRPGFDAVVGNPPWDTVKPNSNEFYSEWDPTYRKLGKQKALARITELETRYPSLRLRWEETERGFFQQSQFLRESSAFRHQGGGDVNTYKLFTERFWDLCRNEGRISLLISSGLGGDLGSTDLRRLYFENGRVDSWFALSNEKFIFQGVHHSFRFLLTAVAKGGTTTSFPFLSRLDPREALDIVACESFLANPKAQCLNVELDTVRKLSPDSLALMGFRTPRDVEIVKKLYDRFPPLGEQIPGTWNVQFATEFHMTNDSHLFRDRDWLTRRGAREVGDGTWLGPEGERYLPLLEGKHIHQFRRTDAQIMSWIHENEGVIATKGTKTEGGMLSPRLTWRWVSSTTNERTLFAALVPSGVFLGNSLPWIRSPDPRTSRYLSVALNSFVCDFLIRFAAAINLTFSIVGGLPVPRHSPLLRNEVELSRISALDSTKDCIELSLSRAAIEARGAEIFEVSTGEFAYLLTSFPLLDRAQPPLPGDLDLDGKPRSYITRDLALLEYFKLRGEKPPDDIVPFFADAGVDISHLTGPMRSLEKRVTEALALGAIAYVPPRPSLRKDRRGDPVDADTADEEGESSE